MVAAAFGYLTPVQGALLQELIDLAVILNALGALNIESRESVWGAAHEGVANAGKPAATGARTRAPQFGNLPRG
jgi:hypothetical protein